MKTKKSLLIISLGLLVAAGVFAAGGSQSGAGAPGAKIAVTFAGTEGATAGQSRMMQEVADTLNATGRFDVKVYVAGALPGDTDNLVTQARLGVNLVVPSDPGRLASQFNIPDLNILMAPYVLTDYKVLEKLPQTALYKEWQAALEAQGVVLIADMFNGFRSFYTTTPVNKVADLSGLRLRGFGNAIGQALAKYLGYAQTTVNATDIYSGVQAKSLDGCEIQASTADSYRLYEVTKYLALSKHYMLQSSFVCGKALLDGMPQADRDLFVKTVYDAAAKYSAIIAQEEQGYYDGFKSKGMTVTEVSIPEFQRAIDSLYTNNDLKLTVGLKDRLFRELGL
ncbi:TRAP transporter substrate-binding protein DctP [Leadbettera azotonutricia]|uniref:Putative trap dicarboxylate transporter, dctp subunit n=1 Tax=Leadbettera azotonutricia (strain ATCC BAA-888 / DSM 13862 / ZAS-9) TaxID=545695 RepID=F5Y8M8_LEAAZ|nr:TRAP transporter substrate-binding protein DctP [Leadbettera azotonutricia]AEF81215.1 putative trap dicarboxylate transporter, dctp subunit [Leadbettera azotonutricia ZAS-9]